MSGMKRTSSRGQHRGLSIVEMLIGIAIGLFILAGATLLVSNQLADNRRLLLETQVQQDLRAAMDLITRDIKRSGYWLNASGNVWPTSPGAVTSNPFALIANHTTDDGRSELRLAYTSVTKNSDPTGANYENNTVDTNEDLGYALQTDNGTIEMKLGASGWQVLTDANVLQVTEFTHNVNTRDVDLPCALACPVGSTTCPPRVRVTDVTLQLTGQARHDANVRHTLRSNIRVRNDLLSGACPT